MHPYAGLSAVYIIGRNLIKEEPVYSQCDNPVTVRRVVTCRQSGINFYLNHMFKSKSNEASA